MVRTRVRESIYVQHFLITTEALNGEFINNFDDLRTYLVGSHSSHVPTPPPQDSGFEPSQTEEAEKKEKLDLEIVPGAEIM